MYITTKAAAKSSRVIIKYITHFLFVLLSNILNIFSKGSEKDCKVQQNNCLTFQVIIVAEMFKWRKSTCLSDNRSFACRHRLFRRL